MEELRKVEKYVEGEWVEILFKEIEKGDTIRMFEPLSGAPVLSESGCPTWLCTKAPYGYVNENGTGTLAISCEDVEV